MRDRVVLAIAVVGGLIAFNAVAEEGTTMTAAHQAVTVFVETVASGEVDFLGYRFGPEGLSLAKATLGEVRQTCHSALRGKVGGARRLHPAWGVRAAMGAVGQSGLR